MPDNIQEQQNQNDQEYAPRYTEDSGPVSDDEEDVDDGSTEGGIESDDSLGPHFDHIEIFLYVSMAIIGDLTDPFWFTRFLFGPATIFWLWLKGVHQVISKNAIAQAVELIPGLDVLPISTVAAIMTVIAVNHPEKFQQWFGAAGEVLEKMGNKKP